MWELCVSQRTCLRYRAVFTMGGVPKALVIVSSLHKSWRQTLDAKSTHPHLHKSDILFLRDARFSQRCCWRLECSGMWFCVVGSAVLDVSEYSSASIVKVKHSSSSVKFIELEYEGNIIVSNLTKLYGITARKTWIIFSPFRKIFILVRIYVCSTGLCY
jgi:hypothetical protein